MRQHAAFLIGHNMNLALFRLLKLRSVNTFIIKLLVI